MSAHASRQAIRRFTVTRDSQNSAMLGNLAILASTTTGEVAGYPKMPAAARAACIALFRSRSARNI